MDISKKNILLVEDEPSQSFLVEHSLKQEGFIIITAFNGEEAIEAVIANHGEFDLVLMDLDLGSSIDGTETAKKILALYDLPVLFLTSHTESDVISRTESISSYGFVLKGSISVLLTSIKMAFRLHDAYKKLQEQEKLRKESQEAVTSIQQQLLKLIEASNDWIWEVNTEGVYTYSSHHICKILGYFPEEIIGKTPFDFMPAEESARLLEIFKGLVAEKKPFWNLENVNIHKDGHLVYLETNGLPRFNSKGEYDGFIGMDRDITERKQIEKAMRDSLKEKEILLSEIHHRVKNNLQVISSMLNLQSDSSNDEYSRELFRSSTNRIRTMALIHEKLYQSRDFSKIDIKEYLTDLSAFLMRSGLIIPSLVSLNVGGQNIYMPIDNAIPCGLIVNELISNSLKHAFHDGEYGKIEINVYLQGRTFNLIISDSGKGLPAGLDITQTESLGLQLVNSLVRQLNGKIHFENSHGLTCAITFVLPEK